MNAVFYERNSRGQFALWSGRELAMNCREIQADLALYGDASLAEATTAAIESHLSACPVCRERAAVNRQLRLDLAALPPETPSPEFSRALAYKLREEIRGAGRETSWFATDAGEWFQRRVMPYAVGAMVSLLMGFVVLNSMLVGFRQNVGHSIETASGGSLDGVMIAANRSPYAESQYSSPISPAEYAVLRRAVSSESPSLNPQGTLISLSGSLASKPEAHSEDGVVVVADVLSNGIARIREVVDPESNRRVMRDLERAFDAQLGDAPFVPAGLDNRSESVRVVLRFQSVDVPAESPANRRR
jgi:hypothetical protein